MTGQRPSRTFTPCQRLIRRMTRHRPSRRFTSCRRPVWKATHRPSLVSVPARLSTRCTATARTPSSPGRAAVIICSAPTRRTIRSSPRARIASRSGRRVRWRTCTRQVRISSTTSPTIPPPPTGTTAFMSRPNSGHSMDGGTFITPNIRTGCMPWKATGTIHSAPTDHRAVLTTNTYDATLLVMPDGRSYLLGSDLRQPAHRTPHRTRTPWPVRNAKSPCATSPGKKP